MVRLIFVHLRGARATEIDVVALGSHRELILGRAPSSAIRFDPQHDAMVGRQHARIVPDPADLARFLLDDLESRNGTYLNGERIAGQVTLRTGDVVTLGSEGPSVQIRVEMSAAVSNVEA